MEKLLKLIKDLTWYNKVEKSKEILRLLTSLFVEDAPQDGTQYARQDGEWAEVETGGGGNQDLQSVLDNGNIAENKSIILTSDSSTGEIDSTGFYFNNPNFDKTVNIRGGLIEIVDSSETSYGVGGIRLGDEYGMYLFASDNNVTMELNNKYLRRRYGDNTFDTYELPQGEDSRIATIKDIDNVNSYLEEETKTGGTWIDGKPIYRIVKLTISSDPANIETRFPDRIVGSYSILEYTKTTP